VTNIHERLEDFFETGVMRISEILSTCTVNKSAVWPLCRLASPKRARNLTMLWFSMQRLSWWFSISFIRTYAEEEIAKQFPTERE
jgi:hypothetical protein